EHARFGDATLRLRVADRHLAGFEARSRNHRCQRVEDAMLRFPGDVPRELLLAGLGHVAGEATGDLRFGHGRFPFECAERPTARALSLGTVWCRRLATRAGLGAEVT